MLGGLFESSVLIVEEMLDYKSSRHNFISANIANIDTPHYLARDLVFDQELLASLAKGDRIKMTKTHLDHLSDGSGNLDRLRPKAIVLETADGLNSVSIDREMVKLAENQLMYNSLVKMISWKFNELKTAISEGRR